MDTRNTPKQDILDRLSGLYLDSTFKEFQGESDPYAAATRQQNAAALGISASTSSKAYRALTAHSNVTTYSLLTKHHECPRAAELDKYQAQLELDTGSTDTREFNPDFAFGHAVGAGIQTFAVTQNLESAILAAWLSWKGPYDAEKEDKYGKPTGKSLTWACYAVELFADFWWQYLSEWEVVVLPSGKAAVELAFAVDFENGFFHFGHIDVVLKNKYSGQLAVWEGKTTAATPKEEMYANSNQALSYSVVVDAVAAAIGADGVDYEVLYIVYDSTNREFQMMPFGKSRAQRAEWILEMVLEHQQITTYQTMNFYPRRGNACYNMRFHRTCKWFGNCTMQTDSLFPGVQLKKLEKVAAVEELDFVFKKSELIAAQFGNLTINDI